jgi:hypothetical protein
LLLQAIVSVCCIVNSRGLVPNLKRCSFGMHSSCVSLQASISVKEPETIQNEIDQMRKEAAERFKKLSIQLEEVKRLKQQADQLGGELQPVKEVILEDATTSLDCLEGDMTRQQNELWEVEKSLTNTISPAIQATTTSASQDTFKITPYSPDLLDGTRWKIVFNIGREAGTWMPDGKVLQI